MFKEVQMLLARTVSLPQKMEGGLTQTTGSKKGAEKVTFLEITSPSPNRMHFKEEQFAAGKQEKAFWPCLTLSQKIQDNL